MVSIELFQFSPDSRTNPDRLRITVVSSALFIFSVAFFILQATSARARVVATNLLFSPLCHCKNLSSLSYLHPLCYFVGMFAITTVDPKEVSA